MFVAVLPPWLLARGTTPRRERLSRALLFACGVALVLMPVALRNWHVGGELHLTTSQFGHNFFIGNNETADGRYRPLIARRADPRIERQDAIEIAERASGRTLTSAEVSAFYSERAVAYILSQPGDWVALLGRKLALAFNAVELVDSKDQYSYGALSPVLRATDFVLHFGVLAPLALLGVLVSWSDRGRLLPLYLLFFSYTATLLVFYIFGRYRLPLVPFLVLFAAAGLVRIRGFAADNPLSKIAAWTAAVAAAALFCTPGTTAGTDL